MPRSKLFLSLIVIAVLLWLSLPQVVTGNWQRAEVVRIIDGDSLILRQDEEIECRLMGIDAPEYGQFLAEEAKAFLSRQVPPGTIVYYTQEVPAQDIYQRQLIHLYRAPEMSFQDSLNAVLVSAGLAVVPDYPDGTMYYAELKQLEQAARQAGLGLHANPD